MSSWKTDKSDDGVLTVTLDVAGKSVNAFSQRVVKELNELIEQVERDSSIKGILFKSGKPGSFIVGADVDEMKDITSPTMAREFVERGQRVFERLSRLNTPTVALISGPCLGGGLEFAMACRHRLADDLRKTALGLPELMLGIVPGWGGTVRLPRLVGLQQAAKMILASSTLNGRQAKQVGLVDDVVPPEALEPAGKVLLQHPPKPRKKSFVQRTLFETKMVKNFILNQAEKMVLKQTKGHYPAHPRAVAVLRAGALEGPEAGFRAEQDAIADLSGNPVTIECIRLFFLREESKKWAEEVAPGYGDHKIGSAAVLGAGTMGAGLAYVMADKGIDVHLKDISPEFVGKGLKHAHDLWAKAVKRKKLTKREADQSAARLHPCTDYVGFKNTEVIIEAVVEDLNIKRKVFADLERVTGPDTVLATNTSSLLISEIAKGVSCPERVVGIHFFNPPNKMPLVEIVRTEQTSGETLAKALALVTKLGKTPIVVKECPGFLVNRLLSPYMNEAGYLLTEVADPFEIEKAAIEFGFPMGPLKLTDLVGAAVAAKVSKVLYEGFGERMKPAPAWDALNSLQMKTDGSGPKTLLIKGKGGKKELHPEVARVIDGLKESRKGANEPMSRTEIAERLVFPIINEAARCLEEGIVDHPEQVDLGMVFGTGFAPFRGGPLRYADKIGVEYVVETLDRFSEGRPRLAPCSALRDRAARKELFETLTR